MNERIRELIEQAGMTLKPRRLYDDNEPDGYLESDLDFLDNNLEATRVFFEGGLEKFAELIVKECANRASWAQDTGEADIGGEVLKHFGVEE
jgi:hypothetical protein